MGIAEGSVAKAVHYIESLNFTEAKFVLVVMVVAAKRPVVALAEKLLNAHALVAGTVTGGGLTVIATAPNPAVVGILQTARGFDEEGISPFRTFLVALGPTLVAIVCFWIV